MRRLWMLLIIISSFGSFIYASTRSNVKILEASENIKYLAQVMAKNYMLLYTHSHKKEYYNQISQEVQEIEKSIQVIALTTKNPKIKQLLDFFAYEKEQLKSNIQISPDLNSASSILDSSDAITEGAERIAKLVSYKFTYEEKMLMTSKRISYLLEKISKYYIVLGSDIDKSTIQEKMDASIKILEDELRKVQDYVYPDMLNQKKENLFSLWDFNKKFYYKRDTLKIPNILLISDNSIGEILNLISQHHSKN